MAQAERFRIKIPISQHKKLKNDAIFLQILVLCRHLNQLYFCIEAYSAAGKGSDPFSTRQRFNGLVFLAGALHEGFRNVDNLRDSFQSYKAYRKEYSEFLKDKVVREVRHKHLNKIRSPLAYHVLNKPLEKALSLLKLREWNFARWTSSNDKDSIHFQFADDLALNSIFPDNIPIAEEKQYIDDVAEKIVTTSVGFARVSFLLIKEYTERKCWKVQESN